ncbi:MAG: carboxymuconolactone decarboxylase family protein [Pseudomonadota bacterium]
MKNTPEHQAGSEDRYERGYSYIQSIFGATGTQFIDRMKVISPDFAHHIVKYAYGDIMSRPALDLATRELAIVSALTALGKAPEELEIHIHGALNVGCSPSALLEVIMQMTVYAGFPAAIHGMQALHTVLTARGLSLKTLEEAQ